jgi:hypothetical protein
MIVDDDTQFWPLVVYLVGLPVVMVAGYKINVRKSKTTKSTIIGALTGSGGGGGGGGGSQKSRKGTSWFGGASSKKGTKANAKSAKSTTNSPMWGGSKG